MKKNLSIALLAAVLALATACKTEQTLFGLDGGGGNVAASFTPAQPSPGAGSVSMAEQSRTGDQVTVAVNVTGVNAVYGAAFSVFYDTAEVEFVGDSPGSILESGGIAAQYSVFETPGQLIVGASRLGGSGVNVTGTLPLIRLTFRALQAGSSPLGFYCQGGCADPGQPALLDDDDAGPQPIAGVNVWAGGTVLAN
jgi:hypothetical protein